MLAKTRWSTQNAERPRLLFRTALSDGMFRLEAGGGVQLACGRCHRPAEPSRLRSAARVGWRRRAPCRPRTSYVLALGAKQPAPNTQCRANCARRLIWPIRALRQQAATCGSEWPRESGAHPWRVPTHSGFTRPRSGMKGPDWGLAGAGTTVKQAAISAVRFWPSRFRTVAPLLTNSDHPGKDSLLAPSIPAHLAGTGGLRALQCI